MSGRPPGIAEALTQRYGGDPDFRRELERARLDLDVSQALVQLRAAAGLSQRELARKVGTSASVICRLEDADYEGHSLSLLRRIAEALGQRVVVRFEPLTAAEEAVTEAATTGRAGAAA